MDIKKPGNNRPLIIFFFLSFGLAWGLMGLAILQNYGLLYLTIPLEPFLVVGSWTPNISVFLVSVFVLKRKGAFKEILKGWLKFKVSLFWYLATLFPIVIALISIFVYKLLYGTFPITDDFCNPVNLIALIIMITITGAMGEELGWRGFALPWLQSYMSALKSSVILGVIWALWHSPLWFAGMGFEDIPFGAYVVIGISFTIMVTWACNNSRGSLVIASLFHLTLNMSVNIIENDALYIHAMFFLIFAVAVALLYGPSKLSKKTDIPVDKDLKSWK